MRLHLDFETGSDLDLTEVGATNYVAHPSTRALLLAYTFDDGPVQLHDFTVDPDFSAPLKTAIEAPQHQKIAGTRPSRPRCSINSSAAIWTSGNGSIR